MTNSDRPGTSLRLVGSLDMSGTVALDEWGLGVTIITQAALSASSLPDPLDTTTPTHGWYLWMAGGLRIENTEKLFDIRSARKVQGDFRMVLIFSTPALNAGLARLEFQARGLWQIG